MTYTAQLTNLMDDAKKTLSELVRLHGEESKFRNDKVLKVSESKFNLAGISYLKEITESALICNYGYEYSSENLNAEDFLELVDFFVKKFNKSETI